MALCPYEKKEEILKCKCCGCKKWRKQAQEIQVIENCHYELYKKIMHIVSQEVDKEYLEEVKKVSELIDEETIDEIRLNNRQFEAYN